MSKAEVKRENRYKKYGSIIPPNGASKYALKVRNRRRGKLNPNSPFKEDEDYELESRREANAAFLRMGEDEII